MGIKIKFTYQEIDNALLGLNGSSSMEVKGLRSQDVNGLLSLKLYDLSDTLATKFKPYQETVQSLVQKYQDKKDLDEETKNTQLENEVKQLREKEVEIEFDELITKDDLKQLNCSFHIDLIHKLIQR